MHVIKRDGKQESVSFDKITERILKLVSKEPRLLNVDYVLIAQKTVAGIFSGVTTQQLDNLAAETAAYMSTVHPEYDHLASRLVISNLHKETYDNYEQLCEILINHVNLKNDVKCPLISEIVYNTVKKYNEEIQNALNYERDYEYDFFGFKTLEKSYLIKIDKKVVERPQQMLMRVAIGIHARDNECNIDEVLDAYDMMSRKLYTHATPTLYNAGTNLPQLSSCFLLQMQDDSIDGIYSTLKQCALISKYAGGIGLSCHNIRSSQSYIRGTNGVSSGIVPMLKVFNDTARYVDQAGKRKGSFAIYLEPWHFDIEDFLELKKNHGKEEMRCRDLFYGLWIPDLFMKKVENDETWCLFCPNECRGLSDCWGEEFENLYSSYEISGKARKVIKARELWDKIIVSQIETGTPYMLYKDACNKKSNQQNLGTIKSSNLCVSGETFILTKKGQIPIKDLVGQKIKVWNGYEWSKTTPYQTGSEVDLLKITMSNGTIIECTPDHKFYIQKNYHTKNSLEIKAKDLKIKQKLIKFDLPKAIEYKNPINFEYPYTHGFYCGDGTDYKQSNGKIYPALCLYNEKIKLLKHIDHESKGKVRKTNNNTNFALNVVLPKTLAKKFVVPNYASISDRLRWLEGLCDADGTIARNGDNEAVQISSIKFDFLNEIKLMLQTLGIHSKVAKSRDNRQTKLPDGKGGFKLYDCQILYRLLISSSGLHKLKNIGFSPKRLKIEGKLPQRNAEQFVTITNIEEGAKNTNTFCFTEPKMHMGVFNGILTGQCTEIVEYTSPDEIAVCFTGDTQINTKNGVKNIVDCDNEEVLSYFDNDIDLNVNVHYEKCKLISNGKKPVYKITIAHDNRCIKATENHLFLTLLTKKNEDRVGNCYTYVKVCGYEWKQLKDLKIDDKIVTIPFGNNKYNIKKDWRFIKNISYFGEEEVYDLSLENSHNFLANGYVVHNCNLASIALPSCVKNDDFSLKKSTFFDHQLLYDITYKVAKNLDKIIDVNYYPLKEAENSNKKHRPIGIGVQGLADVFLKLRLPFDSLEAKKLNKEIFETMYFAAASSSCDNAKINGVYSSYEGSPISKGILCMDMWNVIPTNRWNFSELREKIKNYGLRNSLLIALMPTASTSQILGYNECFEPITTNIYSRRVLAGEFTVINKYLVKDLLDLGIWNDSLKNKIIANEGSVQGIKEIPLEFRLLYRTVWELKMKDLMDMSIDRAAFIDQSQSFNAFIAVPNKNNITSMHFYGWKAGLKTGMYYLRTRPATNAIQFTVDKEEIKKEKNKEEDVKKINSCSIDDGIICSSCGS